jgi:ssDNA-binding Zn-finger/Zn-ribbon topoisomerase 1
LSADEVHSICEQIKEGRLNPSLKTHINHVKHVQQIVSDKQRPTEKKDVEKDDDPICCPKCGSPMVKRKAKRGANAGKEFWGCSAFPRCKKIVPMD